MPPRLVAFVAAARPIVVALVIGGIGALIFNWLRLPLPWMLGPMAATTLASAAGLDLRLPRNLRSHMIVLIALLLGSAFTPEIFGQVAAWATSLIGLIAFVFVATALVLAFMRRALGGDPLTTYLCATPGGMSEMVGLAMSMGADDRTVALSHTARVLIVTMVLPFWFRLFEGYVPPALSAPSAGLVATNLGELVVLVVAGVVGYLAAKWAGLPSPQMIGPLVVSAAMHATGLSTYRPPWELVALAQLVMGAAVGCRFSGVPFLTIVKIMRTGSGAACILLFCTVIFALILHHLTGLSLQSLLLAFSPGGIAEMTLVALALDVDVAFVSTHHTARILIVATLTPILIRLFVPTRPPPH